MTSSLLGNVLLSDLTELQYGIPGGKSKRKHPKTYFSHILKVDFLYDSVNYFLLNKLEIKKKVIFRNT